VAKLERRARGTMALVKIGSWDMTDGVVLSATTRAIASSPVARVQTRGFVGFCRTPKGVASMRQFIVAAHNRGVATAVVHSGYIVATL
jgi:hypothetical protein